VFFGDGACRRFKKPRFSAEVYSALQKFQGLRRAGDAVLIISREGREGAKGREDLILPKGQEILHLDHASCRFEGATRRVCATSFAPLRTFATFARSKFFKKRAGRNAVIQNWLIGGPCSHRAVADVIPIAKKRNPTMQQISSTPLSSRAC
jgi:hypothetical protein